MNILLVGHACLPNAGSELGITWNWAWHLSAGHRVWVITHGSFRNEIETYLREHPRPNLRFVWVGPFGRFDPWKPPSPKYIRLHYLWWRHAALGAARTLMRSEAIDVIHHASWSTLSAPPLLWKLGLPFVWGPVGGGQVIPWRFIPYLGRYVWRELLRTLRVTAMPWNPVLRRTIGRTDLLFAVNRETAVVLEAAGATRLSLFPDVGVVPEILPPDLPFRSDAGCFTVLWAGRFEPRKALPLCLDVAKAVRSPTVRFLIAGDGPLRARMKIYARRLGVESRVMFLGSLPWRLLQERFAEAHVFLFTSVQDTLGSVVFEAVAKGCPVICLDHGGAAHLPDDVAIKISPRTPRRAVEEIARAIDRLASDRAQLKQLSEAAYRWSKSQRWDVRANAMAECYAELLSKDCRPGAARSQRRG